MNASNTIRNKPVRHDLGLQGHFGQLHKLQAGIQPEVQKYIANIGGLITSEVIQVPDDNGDSYKKRIFNLDFGEGAEELNFSGDLKSMNAYLEGLHTPLKTSAQRAVRNSYTPSNASMKQKLKSWWNNREEIKAKSHNERLLLNSLLRFASTGSVVVPEYVHEDLQVDSAACHAGPEQNMRTDNMWDSSHEIDFDERAKRHDPAVTKKPLEPAIIPGSSFDPLHGFLFEIDKAALDNGNLRSAQRELKSWLTKNIQEINGQSLDHDSGFIALKPDEIDQLAQRVHSGVEDKTLSLLLSRVDTEERIDKAIKRIEATLSDFKNSELLQGIVRESADKRTADQKIRDTLRATSSMSRIIGSDFMKESWAYHRNSQKDLPSMGMVLKDLQVLEGVYNHFLENGATDLQREAIAQDKEFYALLGFSEKMAESLEEGFKEFASKQGEYAVNAEGYSRLKQSFRNASTAGIFISEEHLRKEHNDVLDTLQVSLGQGGGHAERFGGELVHNTIDFFEDLYKQPFESVQNFAFFSAMVYLTYQTYALKAQMGMAEEAATIDIATIGNGLDAGVIPGLEGLPDVGEMDSSLLTLNTEDLAFKDMTLEQCKSAEYMVCHTHQILFGLIEYKDQLSGYVGDTSKVFMDIVNGFTALPAKVAGLPVDDAPASIEAASKVSEAVTEAFTTSNNVQSFGLHGPMFASFATMGFMHGLKAFPRIGEFYKSSSDAARVLGRERPGAIIGLVGGLVADHSGAIASLLDTPGTGVAATFAATTLGYYAFKRKGEAKEAVINKIEAAMGASIKPYITEGIEPAIDSEEIYKLFFGEGHEVKSAVIDLEPNKVLNVLGLSSQSGAGSKITLDQSNIAKIIVQINKLSLNVAMSGESLGVDHGTYQNFLEAKTARIVEALKLHQKGGLEEKELAAIFKNDWRDVLAAEVHLTGRSDIFQAAYDTLPSKREFVRLNRAGAAKRGSCKRLQNTFDNAASVEARKVELGHFKRYINQRMACDSRGALDNLKYQSALLGAQVGTGLKVAFDRTKQHLLNPAWEGAVNTVMRPSYGLLQDMPAKKALFWGAAATGVTLGVIDNTGVTGNATLDAITQNESINDLSYLWYGVAGGLATGLAATVVNIVEDKAIVHGAVGGSFLVGASAGHYGVKHGVKPVFGYAKERLRKVLTGTPKTSNEQKNVKDTKACDYIVGK